MLKMSRPEDRVLHELRLGAIHQPELKSRIVDEAERLVRKYGSAKLTVADIANACDMSPANVYRFFESKESIKAAVVEATLKRQENIAYSIARLNCSEGRKLKLLIVEMYENARKQYLKDRNVHELVLSAMREQWPVVDEHVARMRDVCSQIVDSGVHVGEFKPAWKESAYSSVFNATLPFWHPQMIAEKVAGDGHAELMGDFLVEALSGRLVARSR
jgi:AcrR family transcriptional regulator